MINYSIQFILPKFTTNPFKIIQKVMFLGNSMENWYNVTWCRKMGIKVHSIYHVISERITFAEKAMNANGAEKVSRAQHLVYW